MDAALTPEIVTLLNLFISLQEWGFQESTIKKIGEHFKTYPDIFSQFEKPISEMILKIITRITSVKSMDTETIEDIDNLIITLVP